MCFNFLSIQYTLYIPISVCCIRLYRTTAWYLKKSVLYCTTGTFKKSLPLFSVSNLLCLPSGVRYTVNHLPSLRLYSKPSDCLFLESVRDSRFEPATTVSAFGALSMSHHILFINTHFLVSHVPLFRESLPLFRESTPNSSWFAHTVPLRQPSYFVTHFCCYVTHLLVSLAL